MITGPGRAGRGHRDCEPGWPGWPGGVGAAGATPAPRPRLALRHGHLSCLPEPCPPRADAVIVAVERRLQAGKPGDDHRAGIGPVGTTSTSNGTGLVVPLADTSVTDTAAGGRTPARVTPDHVPPRSPRLRGHPPAPERGRKPASP